MSSITAALLVFFIAPFIAVRGAPALDAQSLKQNGAAAQKLNAQFASLKATDPCQEPDMACVQGSFAQCVGGQWQTTACAGGTQCFALPLVNKIGTSITCDTQVDVLSRISNTGVSGGLTGNGNGTDSGTIASPDLSNSTDAGCSIDATSSNSTNPLSGASNTASSPSVPPAELNGTLPDASNSTDMGTNCSDVSATLSTNSSLPLSSPPSSASLPDSVNGTGTGTDVGVFSSLMTTITLTPASASAALLLGQVGQPSPSSVPPVATFDAPPAATGVNGMSSNAISLSLFTTMPTGALSTAPTPSGSAGAGGYGY